MKAKTEDPRPKIKDQRTKVYGSHSFAPRGRQEQSGLSCCRRRPEQPPRRGFRRGNRSLVADSQPGGRRNRRRESRQVAEPGRAAQRDSRLAAEEKGHQDMSTEDQAARNGAPFGEAGSENNDETDVMSEAMADDRYNGGYEEPSEEDARLIELV